MAPTVPTRHPGRLSQQQAKQPTTIPTPNPKISKEHFDIWDHAEVLYSSFEWQAAAETFLMLSRQISKQWTSLCLLNAAIIFARLGDFTAASQILSEVEPEGDLLPFTMFITGHVEFEQGNFDKSKECFKITLSKLHGGIIRYDRYGLDYALRTSHVQQNLRIFDTNNSLFGILGTIGAIPADGIFDSPARQIAGNYSFPLLSPTRSQASTNSDDIPGLSQLSSPASLSASPTSFEASPIEKRADGASDDVWWHSRRDSAEVMSNYFDVGGGIHQLDSQSIAPSLGIKSSDPQAVASVVRRLSERQTPTLATPRRAPRHSLVPREARVQGGSVNGLAEFIRSLPAQNALEPRNAEGRPDSTSPLAEFFKDSGPAGPPKQHPNMIHPALRRRASDQSVYSQDSKAESIAAADRVTEEELIQRSEARGIPQPPTRHPSHRYQPGHGPFLKQISPSPQVKDMDQSSARDSLIYAPTNLDADSLRSFAFYNSSDKASARSFAFTDEAMSTPQRSLPQSGNASPSLHRSMSTMDTPSIHPTLRGLPPSRKSTLITSPTSLQQMRETRPVAPSITRSATPSTVASSQVSKQGAKAAPRKEIGYSKYFGRWAGKF